MHNMNQNQWVSGNLVSIRFASKLEPLIEAMYTISGGRTLASEERLYFQGLLGAIGGDRVGPAVSYDEFKKDVLQSVEAKHMLDHMSIPNEVNFLTSGSVLSFPSSLQVAITQPLSELLPDQTVSPPSHDNVQNRALQNPVRPAFFMPENIGDEQLKPSTLLGVAADPQLCTPALRSLIDSLITSSMKSKCRNRNLENEGAGTYQCTITAGCKRRFKSLNDWKRHEANNYTQDLWFCTECGDPADPCKNSLFCRKDKLQSHLRKKHPNTDQTALGRFRIRNTNYPRCGFCNRAEFCDWNARYKHIAQHFEQNQTVECDWKFHAEETNKLNRIQEMPVENTYQIRDGVDLGFFETLDAYRQFGFTIYLLAFAVMARNRMQHSKKRQRSEPQVDDPFSRFKRIRRL
ncbi:hypothetical protein BS50DRAFT_291512 [Corynespora cassiicola Philippines]|uniref:C2H2-type domain-containing protein n=1 Tax=Corynespora cassiicola Philippines TaxID=1448308 RepID=A0A2T2NVX9_CORCC|nr:hypothetical protein BS50DRAFT_291512 [Corynespora cassiicola Philippines]